MYYAAYIGNEHRHHIKVPLAVVSAGHLRTDDTSPAVSGPTRPHGFPDYQLLYLRSGVGHYLIDGEERIVTAGNAILFRPHRPQIYRYYKEEGAEVFWVHFGGTAADALIENTFPRGETVFKAPPETVGSIKAMIDELQMCRNAFECSAAAHLLTLLTVLARREEPSSTTARIHAVCRRMADRPAAPYSNDELAAACGMSSSGFAHRFKETVGVAPREYLLQQRLSAARTLLENTALPIGEVAEAAGFEDALYFSKFFKSRTGMSPSVYRNYNNPEEKKPYIKK